MPFTIPDVPVADLGRDALTRYLEQANAAYAAAFSVAQDARTAGTITPAMLDELRGLNEFRTNAAAQLATFTPEVTPETQERLANDLSTFAPATDPAPTSEPEGGAAPTIADVAAGTQLEPPRGTPAAGISLTASASVGAFNTGQELDFDQLGNLLYAKIQAMAGLGNTTLKESVFSINRPTGDFIAYRDRRDHDTMRRLVDQSRLPGGSLMAGFAGAKSLTASMGWCAPSPIDYGIRTTYAADGLLNLPSIDAPRGGVFVMPELTFNTVYGGYTGTNFFNLTEAQVQAGVPKNFIEIDCPDPTETRLRVDGVGIVGNLLAMRGYPEYSREFVDGCLVGLRHFEAALQVGRIQVLCGAAINLAADPLWLSDGSVFSQTMNAIDMAATDIRSHKRMGRTATMECLLPEWWLADVRADLARRPGLDVMWKQDAWIIAAFAAINVVPQFLKDYQDAYAVTAANVGGAAPITQFPTTLEFVLYAPGTFALAKLPVINVSMVYDATRLAANQRIELFHEIGWEIIQLLADPRRYTINICPTGSVGATHTISCTETQP